MPYSGKYRQESQGNFEPFMRALGVPEDHIKLGRDLKTLTEIEENGDHFKMTMTTGSEVKAFSFTVGQECEMESFTGEKFMGVVKRDGNKLTCNMNGIESVTELVDANTLVNTMTFNGITFKTTSKRV
ncbi:unnamed protein product [Knipowitschia caucasica]|uniref:Uncharacterized protein n=1 Tax=Knipowitschia caucasica TaxID=637954 RepID=A0AAV2MQD0_KNICA